LKIGYVAEVVHELVAVDWIDGDRDPPGLLVLIKTNAENLKYRRVVRQAKERSLIVVWPAGGDPVPVADLLQPERVS
jgi:hypothetical protein